MTKRPNSLALKIAQIMEDHTSDEIEAAIRLLGKYGRGTALFDFLSDGRGVSKPQPRGPRPSKQRISKPIEETSSRAILKLEKSDPKKFSVLSGFDRLVRSENALQTNLALRQFGAKISKNFKPGKSRKELISAVMTVLSERPLEDIEQLIAQTVVPAKREDGSEYQRLADFLIKGRTQPLDDSVD